MGMDSVLSDKFLKECPTRFYLKREGEEVIGVEVLPLYWRDMFFLRLVPEEYRRMKEGASYELKAERMDGEFGRNIPRPLYLQR